MFRWRLALVLIALLGALPAADPPSWWDVADVRIWYAQHGYAPEHPKVVTTALTAERFRIERAADGQEVFTGELRAIDRGWRQGDFTAFRTPGTYRIRIGDESGPGTFIIAPHRWDDLLQASAWHYFGLRRMGEDNVVGNLGDERLVNWEHARIVDAGGVSRYKYIGRAWGDGDDGRTYASCSLVVTQYCALYDTNPIWDRGDWIYLQVRWGLDGALSFLEKDGTLRWILSSQDHQQNSYDNRFYSGDEKRLVAWNDVKGATEEYNDANPEVIAASLLIGPAYATALFRERDPAFFARVEALVRLGHRRIGERYGAFPTKYSLGAWIWLNVAMHRMTGEARFLDLAAEGADRLVSLQQQEFVGDDAVQAKGWFRRDPHTTANPQGEKPEQEVMITPWIYQGLFQLIAAHPTHPRNAAWRAAVGSYARDYLLALGRQNPFGFTPMKVMVLEPEQKNPLRQRRGNLAWANFSGRMGRQFHQIGNAAFLVQVGRLLQDDELVAAGWRQLFWFSGHNPKGLASINGFGTNVNSGQHFRDTLGRRFPGGTVNGALGNTQDQPWFWGFNEYYTYGNLNVLWFATVACGAQFSDPLALWPREIQESPHTADPEHHPRATFPVRLKGRSIQRFAGLVPEQPDQPIVWSVDGVSGGNATVGTIAPDGTYTAPRVAAPRQIRIEAVATQDPTRRAATAVTIMPAPGAVPGLRLTTAGAQVDLTWDRADGLVAGYTIWKRLPVGSDAVGTIFEMVGAVGPDETRYTYPNPRIRHYQDDLLPTGTEFLVRAYAERRDPDFRFPPTQGWHPGWEQVAQSNPNAIYGFGNASPVGTLSLDLSRTSTP
jgi:hypothetical protein